MLGSEFGGQAGPGTLWQGNMADMDGMTLVDKDNHGVLTDKSGHTLWTGLVQPRDKQAAYTAISDTAKPNYLTLQDRQGRPGGDRTHRDDSGHLRQLVVGAQVAEEGDRRLITADF